LDVNIVKRLRAVALVALLAASLAPGAALAEESATSEAGVGALSAVSSLIYGPAKILYALTGTLIGGMAWGLSGGDSQVLHAVVSPAVRGDYVVTPEHIRMEKQVEFFGQEPQYRETETYSAVPQDPVVGDSYDSYGSKVVADDYGVVSEDF
jgi:hypothetical protein